MFNFQPSVLDSVSYKKLVNVRNGFFRDLIAASHVFLYLVSNNSRRRITSNLKLLRHELASPVREEIIATETAAGLHNVW